jgi:quinol monooxygenase YgiN
VTTICTVIAIFTPKPEFASEVKALIQRITPLVHEEAGCEFYTMNEDVDGRIIHIEAWSTREHWQEHSKQQNVADIWAGIQGKLQKDVEIIELYNVPTGTSGKGTLAQAKPVA